MSLYQVQKFLYHLNRDEQCQDKFHRNIDALLDQYDLNGEERAALKEGDIGLLYVLGVNGQILMHYAALLNIEWFDYLELMRQGVVQHGSVRAGVYAMTGGGASFTVEGAVEGEKERDA
ncbi:MAG: aromatic ring-opening dioxygenase subunit LigA [Pseudomonadota bacterium]